MSKATSHEKNDFDCSAYLSHGLQWPINEYQKWVSCSKSNIGARNPNVSLPKFNNQCDTESVTVRDWRELLQEEMNNGMWKERTTLRQKDKNPIFRKEKKAGKFQEKQQYYESEYNNLLKWMDEEEIIVPPPSMFADKREEIQRLSMVAEEALGCRNSYKSYPSCNNRQKHNYMYENLANEVAFKAIESPRTPVAENYDGQESSGTYEDLAKEVAIKAIETPRTPPGAINTGEFQNFVEEQLVGFGDNFDKKRDTDVRKRRLCRHFVKGFCIRADSCEFLHDPSIFCTDDQKVFLGGLPLHMTPAILKAKLKEQDLTVLNTPRIMRGFTPQVCLGSVEEAEKMIAKRCIYIDNHRVDVRPFQDREQLRQGLPSIVKRSVFLGGLPENTTGEMIVADLQRLDIKVANFPVVKNGYVPRVVLGSVEHAKMLVSLKKVKVNNTAVDVRPYVNFRKRY